MGTSYNLLTKNCNHFTSYLCQKLTGRPAPSWLNRAASIGVALPCVVPREWIGMLEQPKTIVATNRPQLHRIMILRMESSLTRTLKTKDRLCSGMINNDGACEPTRTMRRIGRRPRRKGYLALAVEVSKEVQEGILGTRPEIMPQESSRTLRIGRFLQQREHRYPEE